MFRDVLERAVLCLVIVANAKDAGQYFSNFPFYFLEFRLFDILQYFETILSLDEVYLGGPEALRTAYRIGLENTR